MDEPEQSNPGPETGPEFIARGFHEVYEQLAPVYGYETRKESAVAWEDVPAVNKRLMVKVVTQLLHRGAIEHGSSSPWSSRSRAKRLSIKARALPESLRSVARYGASPLGVVTLSAQQLMELADAAQELADAAGVERL